uniref:Uncharacterized protein n=1 Tax=Solanum lycopersicum TaxID=4081 RepID=A0A3Q7HC24_SOLLC
MLTVQVNRLMRYQLTMKIMIEDSRFLILYSLRRWFSVWIGGNILASISLLLSTNVVFKVRIHRARGTLR